MPAPRRSGLTLCNVCCEFLRTCPHTFAEHDALEWQCADALCIQAMFCTCPQTPEVIEAAKRTDVARTALYQAFSEKPLRG